MAGEVMWRGERRDGCEEEFFFFFGGGIKAGVGLEGVGGRTDNQWAPGR